MSLIPTCPNCGDSLDRLEKPPADTPPWLCAPCSRGWWDAELHTDVRDDWDPATRAFHPDVTPAVLAAADQERAAAAAVKPPPKRNAKKKPAKKPPRRRES